MSAPPRFALRTRIAVALLAFVGSGALLLLVADATRWRAMAIVIVAALLGAGEAWAQRTDDCADDADPLCLPSALALLAVLLVATHAANGTHASSPLLTAAALAVMIVSAALRVASVAALGSAFVSQTRAHAEADRVRHGPYALMRHPSEIGQLGVAFGAAMLAASPAAITLCVAVLTPLALIRMRREERDAQLLGV